MAIVGQFIKHLYVTNTGHELNLSCRQAGRLFGIHETTISKYIKQGFTLNEIQGPIFNNNRTLTIKPSTVSELFDVNIDTLNTWQDRLKKFCVAHRIPEKPVMSLMNDYNYTARDAIIYYLNNRADEPKGWKYIISDIVLVSFCNKYALDRRVLTIYLKKYDNNVVRALETYQFLYNGYYDFDITPKVRAELLDIYNELKEIDDCKKLEILKERVREKKLASKTYNYLNRKYGNNKLINYYFNQNIPTEITEELLINKTQEEIINFFESKYNKAEILKRDVEYLYIKGLYDNSIAGDEVLNKYQVTPFECDYIFNSANGRGINENLYDGYTEIIDHKPNIDREVQLNDRDSKRLTYSKRWYY